MWEGSADIHKCWGDGGATWRIICVRCYPQLREMAGRWSTHAEWVRSDPMVRRELQCRFISLRCVRWYPQWKRHSMVPLAWYGWADERCWGYATPRIYLCRIVRCALISNSAVARETKQKVLIDAVWVRWYSVVGKVTRCWSTNVGQ